MTSTFAEDAGESLALMPPPPVEPVGAAEGEARRS